jgi:hypothetical protein
MPSLIGFVALGRHPVRNSFNEGGSLGEGGFVPFHSPQCCYGGRVAVKNPCGFSLPCLPATETNCDLR